MDRKRFAKYFAQKPPVVLYVVGGVLLAGCIMGVVSLLGFSAFGAIAG